MVMQFNPLLTLKLNQNLKLMLHNRISMYNFSCLPGMIIYNIKDAIKKCNKFENGLSVTIF